MTVNFLSKTTPFLENIVRILVKPINILKMSEDPSNGFKLLGLVGCEHEA